MFQKKNTEVNPKSGRMNLENKGQSEAVLGGGREFLGRDRNVGKEVLTPHPDVSQQSG